MLLCCEEHRRNEDIKKLRASLIKQAQAAQAKIDRTREDRSWGVGRDGEVLGNCWRRRTFRFSWTFSHSRLSWSSSYSRLFPGFPVLFSFPVISRLLGPFHIPVISRSSSYSRGLNTLETPSGGNATKKEVGLYAVVARIVGWAIKKSRWNWTPTFYKFYKLCLFPLILFKRSTSRGNAIRSVVVSDVSQ